MTPDRLNDEIAVKKWVDTVFSCFRTNDLETFLSLYDDDIILMPPNQPTIYGIKSIREMVQPWFEQYTMTNEVGDVEIRIDSELAFVRVDYKDRYWSQEGDVHKLDNKAIWILQRQPNNEWKGIRGIYNRNRPPE
jgi:ketosteroid isomerase-like protein